INDGERRGNNWGKGGTGSGWNDGTSGTYPDWVQITFSGVQSISQINVYTLADNFASLTADPTSGSSFTKYGIVDFQVQYWTGTDWQNVPGGSITGNNLVLRSVSFAPINTDRIRVNITNALYWNSRIVELEAWTPSP
uniref:hypothetical protein n=1 Tax=Pelomonas sp. KK5 TaxID=1855730 RepID=UPI0018E97A80